MIFILTILIILLDYEFTLLGIFCLLISLKKRLHNLWVKLETNY